METVSVLEKQIRFCHYLNKWFTTSLAAFFILLFPSPPQILLHPENLNSRRAPRRWEPSCCWGDEWLLRLKRLRLIQLRREGAGFGCASGGTQHRLCLIKAECVPGLTYSACWCGGCLISSYKVPCWKQPSQETSWYPRQQHDASWERLLGEGGRTARIGNNSLRWRESGQTGPIRQPVPVLIMQSTDSY